MSRSRPVLFCPNLAGEMLAALLVMGITGVLLLMIWLDEDD